MAEPVTITLDTKQVALVAFVMSELERRGVNLEDFGAKTVDDIAADWARSDEARAQAGAVAGLVEAAKEALALLDDTRDTAARFKAGAILGGALAALDTD
jgi:hypothetical protein